MTSLQVKWIGQDEQPDRFPDVSCALDEPNGLLAAGGDLTSARILYAYRHGIFPWYETGQPILWWSPDPRCVLPPADLKLSARQRRYFRRGNFEMTFNTDFAGVIRGCAAARKNEHGTWITPEMLRAFDRLHREGWAHSVEIWSDGKLAGGLYGIAIGRVFFGESMFSRISNASKAALAILCATLIQQQFVLLDCQVESPHLTRLGATLIDRKQFTEQVLAATTRMEQARNWPERRCRVDDYLVDR